MTVTATEWLHYWMGYAVGQLEFLQGYADRFAHHAEIARAGNIYDALCYLHYERRR